MITKNYVLFIRIPLFQTADGRLYCDELWAKDLKLHLNYIENFSLCCPVVMSEEVSGLTEVNRLSLRKIFPLRMDYGYLTVIRNLIPNFWRVFQACRYAEIVHSDAAGWAFPLSFYVYFIRPFLKFKWIIVIESSFWMVGKAEKVSIGKRINHMMHEFFLKSCVRRADARIFTQSFYRRYFLGDEKERTLITPATWINHENLISEAALKIRALNFDKHHLNLIFPTRLIEEKGVRVLFAAIEELGNRDINVSITIMGKGNLEGECIDFSNKDFGKVKVFFKTAVSYGQEFFETLRQYDAVLVPNLKEEQPRIVFDAFSQGVAVIASDTSGILDIVEVNKNALIFIKGDYKSLADAIELASKNPEIIRKMGASGWTAMSDKTHLNMHLARSHFFEQVL